MNELKIEVPQGMVIDTEKSNLTNGIIKFKPIEKQLPKTWEEFCKTHPITENECYIDVFSKIKVLSRCGRGVVDMNVLPSYEIAKAMLALCQLIQLRDCYNDGWKPDWSDDNIKFVIFCASGEIEATINISSQRVLAFKTAELRNQFLENFRHLIVFAKDLI
jgi:hypothetical protein